MPAQGTSIPHRDSLDLQTVNFNLRYWLLTFEHDIYVTWYYIFMKGYRRYGADTHNEAQSIDLNLKSAWLSRDFCTLYLRTYYSFIPILPMIYETFSGHQHGSWNCWPSSVTLILSQQNWHVLYAHSKNYLSIFHEISSNGIGYIDRTKMEAQTFDFH